MCTRHEDGYTECVLLRLNLLRMPFLTNSKFLHQSSFKNHLKNYCGESNWTYHSEIITDKNHKPSHHPSHPNSHSLAVQHTQLKACLIANKMCDKHVKRSAAAAMPQILVMAVLDVPNCRPSVANRIVQGRKKVTCRRAPANLSRAQHTQRTQRHKHRHSAGGLWAVRLVVFSGECVVANPRPESWERVQNQSL